MKKVLVKVIVEVEVEAGLSPDEALWAAEKKAQEGSGDILEAIALG